MQGVGDFDEAFSVEFQPGFSQPRCAAGARDPNDLVGIKGLARCSLQLVGEHLLDFTSAMHDDFALRKHRVKAPTNAGVVRGQYVWRVGEQVKRQVVGIALSRCQFGAKSELHRQQQFHAASACADHRNGRFASAFLYAIEQR